MTGADAYNGKLHRPPDINPVICGSKDRNTRHAGLGIPSRQKQDSFLIHRQVITCLLIRKEGDRSGGHGSEEK